LMVTSSPGPGTVPLLQLLAVDQFPLVVAIQEMAATCSLLPEWRGHSRPANGGNLDISSQTSNGYRIETSSLTRN